MRISGLQRIAIPKAALVATALAGGLLVATVDATPAQALPSYASACSACHTPGGAARATPSTTTPARGAAYTVAIAFTGGSDVTGYWISGNGASVNGTSTSATMTAPAAAGTYSYTVWVRQGVTASTTYSITVGAPPTTVPPVSSRATITRLSSRRGNVGSAVVIKGKNFGKAGKVKFGKVSAKVRYWSRDKIVVTVPAVGSVRVVRVVRVTVTPSGGKTSNDALFYVSQR